MAGWARTMKRVIRSICHFQVEGQLVQSEKCWKNITNANRLVTTIKGREAYRKIHSFL
jgi:hypothetical protein